MTVTQSPETTGDWRCPKCPNTTHFIGYDHNGYGGPAGCECGAYDDDEYPTPGAECSCSTVLKQPFTVLDAATEDGYDGEIVYSAFEGGGSNAEIGSYDTIECGACGAIVWNEVPPEEAPEYEVEEGEIILANSGDSAPIKAPSLPYPWCYQPEICKDRGSCPREPNCGD